MAHHRGNVLILFATLLLTLASCSVNPFRTDNEMTGTAAGTAIGAGVGGVTAVAAHASKVEIALAALAGGAAGYYFSSLNFASGGVTHVGGQVYTLGDYVTIEIPSDRLFDVNTADFLPEAGPILNSVTAVLNRYPNSNIMISGNTSGFYADKYERKISEDRARQVAAYLWAHGVNNFTEPDSNVASVKSDNTYMRNLSYVGYGSYFPISNTITAEGIRQNSRIQITVYPRNSQITLNKCGRVFNNVGSIDDGDSDSNTTSNTTKSYYSSYASDNNSLNNIKSEMTDSYS